MSHFDPAALARAIDAWERRQGPFDVAPYERFRNQHRLEARYLWLLANRFAPPKDLIPSALRNLVAWELVSADGRVSPLGRRLLRSGSKQRLAPDPFASGF